MTNMFIAMFGRLFPMEMMKDEINIHGIYGNGKEYILSLRISFDLFNVDDMVNCEGRLVRPIGSIRVQEGNWSRYRA